MESITLTGNATSGAFSIGTAASSARSIQGGTFTVSFYDDGGSWQGTTLKIEFSADGTNGWAPLKTDNTLATDFSATDDGSVNLELEHGFIRFVTTGSGSPESVITVAIPE